MSSRKYHYRISTPVTEQRETIWNSSSISTKRSGGGWLIFLDKNKKPLNQDQPSCKVKKKYYQHIPYIGPSPHDFDDDDMLPRNTEVSKNYNAFIPKRELVSTYRETYRTRVPDDEDYIASIGRKGWIGREPLTAPFRMSTKLLNERRMKELQTMRKTIKSNSPYRSPRRLHKTNTKTSSTTYFKNDI